MIFLADGDVVKSKSLPSFYAPLGQLDTDTPLGEQSLLAASRFCGAAMLAVDAVMSSFNKDVNPSSIDSMNTQVIYRFFLLESIF